MPHVTLVNSFYDPDIRGGAEITIRDLAGGLALAGHEVSVITLAVDGTARWETIGSARVYRIPVPNLYLPNEGKSSSPMRRLLWKSGDVFNFSAYRSVARVLEELKPDLVQTHNLAGLSSSVWWAARCLGKPLVHVLHDYYQICPNINMLRGEQTCRRVCMQCRALRIVNRRLSSDVEAVIGVSRAVLRRHLEAGSFARSPIKRVIYNSRKIEPQQDRRDPRYITIGFLGGVSPPKGIELLLRQFAKIREKYGGSVRLCVAGRGDVKYLMKLRSSYGLDGVEFLGYVVPADFLPKLDVLVVPSIWEEPLGNIVYEAMACGVAVIGSNRGGIPEMITEGVNGLVFEPSDESALAMSISRIIEDPKFLGEMRARARTSVGQFLSQARMAAEYTEVYREVLARRD